MSNDFVRTKIHTTKITTMAQVAKSINSLGISNKAIITIIIIGTSPWQECIDRDSNLYLTCLGTEKQRILGAKRECA